jgi:hypothetical protein
MFSTLLLSRNRADHVLLIGEKLVDPRRSAVAVTLQLVQPPAAGGRHRRLRRRDQRRKAEQHDERRTRKISTPAVTAGLLAR